MKDCLKGRVQINVDPQVVHHVHKTFKSKLRIVRYIIKHPERFDPYASPGEEADPVELLLMIQMSVLQGKANMEAIQKAAEYAFQFDLAGIYGRLKEIDESMESMESMEQYLECLMINLNWIIKKLDM
jgi:hypothetical protein